MRLNCRDIQIEVVVICRQLDYKGLKSRRSNRLWNFFNSKMGHFLCLPFPKLELKTVCILKIVF